MRLTIGTARANLREAIASATNEPVEIVNNRRQGAPVEAALIDGELWESIRDSAIVQRRMREIAAQRGESTAAGSTDSTAA